MTQRRTKRMSSVEYMRKMRTRSKRYNRNEANTNALIASADIALLEMSYISNYEFADILDSENVRVDFYSE